MDKFIEKLEQYGKEARKNSQCSLRAEEKRNISNTLLAVMKEDSSRLYNGSITNIKNNIISMIIAIIAALFLGGGVSFAAENTVPGDLLYPVKVSINEEVESFLAFSNEQEARLQAKLAGKRLAEAETLAADGRLDAETGALITASFNEHANESEDRTEEISAGGGLETAANIHSDFETALQAHERVLAKIKGKIPEVQAHVNAIMIEIQAKIGAIASARTEAEANLTAEDGESAKSAADGAMRAAKNKIAEVKSYIEKKGGDFSAEARTEAKVRIAAAESTFASAEARSAAGAEGEAFSLFMRAHREAEGAKLALMAMQEFNLDTGVTGEVGVDIDTGTSTSFQGGEQGTSTENNGGEEEEVSVEVEGSVNTNASSTGNREVNTSGKIKIGL